MIHINNNYFDQLPGCLILEIASYLSLEERKNFFLAQKRLYILKMEDQQRCYHQKITRDLKKTYEALKVNGVADDVLLKIKSEIEVPPPSEFYEDRIGGLSKIVTPLTFALQNLPAKQLEIPKDPSKLSRIMIRVFSLAGLLQKADQILMQQNNTTSEESKEMIKDSKETISDRLQNVVEQVLQEDFDPQIAISRMIADKIPDPKIKKTIQEKVNFIEKSIYLRQECQRFFRRGQFDKAEKIVLEKVTNIVRRKRLLGDIELHRLSSAMVKARDDAGDLEEFARLKTEGEKLGAFLRDSKNWAELDFNYTM